MAAAVIVASVVVALLLGGVGGFVIARRSASPDEPAQSTVAESTTGLGPLTEAVERVAHGIIVVDGSGAVVYRNRVASQLSVARHSRSLVEDCVQRLLTVARRGESCNEEVELFGPPAELFFVSAHPFRDRSGTGAMAVVEDRSEIRRTETVRRDFVANISHELKTPIGALVLLAETIEGETDPEIMRRLAGRMVNESERAAGTIDDLLELSRIEFADDAERTEVALTDVVREAVARITNAAEQSGVAIDTDVVDQLTVQGDPRQLVSALFNMLDNAVKYSPRDSAIQVRVDRDESRDKASVSVTDQGIGIPRSSVERVFERFYRVDGARARNTGGTGLGLAIVRHVVSNHGGEVLLDSTEGRGSVFTMVLPLSGAVAT
jgi:two-component system sensor histidine kinase SenX3